MEEHQVLAAFAALSQETRLRVLRLLVAAGPEGLPAGTVAERVAVSASNVSFHLKELERAGLVGFRRDGRSVVYSAAFDALSGLIRFLVEDCCSGRPEICLPAIAAPRCAPSSARSVRPTEQ